MSIVSKRNQKVLEILNELYTAANNSDLQINESEYSNDMEMLFSTDAWGFREILLVVVVGMKLDSNFRASTGLYDCNPRAIYEGPIKEFLISNNIPHRKSGPLNVAKATVGLDMTWATQRRPSKVAEAVVRLVQYMELDTEESNTRIANIGVSLFRRLISCTERLEALAVNIDPSSDPVFLFELCYELITKTPDAGNTPQKIAAFLLKNYHLCFNTGVMVTGGEDRASVTSTTSKKPGDINEECAGRIYKVYEITVKAFDIARIRDSYDCITIYNNENSTNINEVIVICRPEDCYSEIEKSTLNGYLGRYAFNNIIYIFVDIFEWISHILQHMTEWGRQAFYIQLNDYVNEINTSESVKILWKQLHI